MMNYPAPAGALIKTPSVQENESDLKFLVLFSVNCTWRIVYHIEDDAIVILEVFQKQTQQTPHSVIEACKRRIRLYDSKG